MELEGKQVHNGEVYGFKIRATNCSISFLSTVTNTVSAKGLDYFDSLRVTDLWKQRTGSAPLFTTSKSDFCGTWPGQMAS
uniref:Uncharacterized protein n=1 Tax=Knipowitschia caucasica TaxID=637954 RepID=A0AAV2J0G8_KNICA